MSILQVDPTIRAFFTDDESVNDIQGLNVRRLFQTTVSDLFEYGALEYDASYNLKLAPSKFQAVRPTRRPLVPMYIALIPPDVFPSGNFTTTRVPSPQDVDLTLIRTRSLSRRGPPNVEGVREASALVVSQNGYVIRNESRDIQIEHTLRTGSGQLASGNLPITYVSSDPGVATVSDTGLVSFQSRPTTPVTVTLSTTTQSGLALGDSVVFTTDGNFQITEAPSPTLATGLPDNAIETRVSEGEDLGTDFLESLKSRYETLRTQGRASDVDFDDQLLDVTKRRARIVDAFAEESESIREERVIGANEASLRRQVQVFKALPPLVMYINPRTFNLSYEHLISDGNRGRNGYIIEHWGLNQPTLSMAGEIGAYYVTSVGNNGQATGGLTRKHRRGSAAYQHFMSLYHAYRNNGTLFNNDGRMSLIGAVKIFYDNTIYTGSFNSFTIEEDESKPYTLSYTLEFTIRFEEKIISDPTV